MKNTKIYSDINILKKFNGEGYFYLFNDIYTQAWNNKTQNIGVLIANSKNVKFDIRDSICGLKDGYILINADCNIYNQVFSNVNWCIYKGDYKNINNVNISLNNMNNCNVGIFLTNSYGSISLNVMNVREAGISCFIYKQIKNIRCTPFIGQKVA